MRLLVLIARAQFSVDCLTFLYSWKDDIVEVDTFENSTHTDSFMLFWFFALHSKSFSSDESENVFNFLLFIMQIIFWHMSSNEKLSEKMEPVKQDFDY